MPTQATQTTGTRAAADPGLWFMTAQIKVCQSRSAPLGQPSVIHHRMACGFAPPRHVHHDEDETFVILDGQFRFEVGGAVRELGAGEAIYLPRGVAHGFRVISPEGGRCLTITGGGFEAMVRAASRPALDDGLPEQLEPGTEAQAELARLCEAHGIALIGPPID